MASNNELACVYAALILADDQVTVTADKINTILKAANVSVEPYWPSLFARALDGVDIKAMLSNIGSMAAAPAGGAPAGGAAPAGDAAAAPAKEEKKEEKKEESEESDDDMGFGLFD
ncbi:60S acidic ribosomal protein P1 [Octopus bimaculoides]|uniref:Large ribosomal subunit protein P1 n=1 Tax=Octopus bimaculoides TaxID=37653 RepID=A0A0L8FF90_OCTBM|nr:60S acidic ribosomal protein P1 [Octopus bimaculoides]|eukprot:XP_014790358.1 PREDICTED: 60S acidic ribosomal protein P1-like [Octopus bimaculoides]